MLACHLHYPSNVGKLTSVRTMLQVFFRLVLCEFNVIFRYLQNFVRYAHFPESANVDICPLVSFNAPCFAGSMRDAIFGRFIEIVLR